MSSIRPRSPAPLLGQGPRHLRRSATTACCSSPPIASRPSTWSWPSPSPTRAGCSPPCRRSGSSTSPTSSPATSSRPTSPTCRSRPVARSGRAGSCCAGGPRCCRSSASCAATSPGRPGRSTVASGTMHGDAAARGAARVGRSCPSRCSPRRPRPTTATTRTSPSTTACDLVGTQAGRAGSATSRSSSTPRGAAWAAERAASSSPTPSSSWASIDGELVAGRRGPHPGLVAVLAGRRTGSPARPRRRSTSSRCGTTSTASTGTSSRRPRRFPPRSCRHPRPLRRGLRAHHRPLVRRLARITERRRLVRPGGRAAPA